MAFCGITEIPEVDENHSMGDCTSAHTRPLPESLESNDSSTTWIGSAETQTFKRENYIFPQTQMISTHSFSEFSSIPNSETSIHEAMMRQTRLFNGKKNWRMDYAVAPFEVVSFEVIKINSRKKEQDRVILLSAYGISNIRPPRPSSKVSSLKVSSLERWCDVRLCWKVDGHTVAIKYENAERRYRTKSKITAENLFNSLRLRVNAHQEHSRKLLQIRMINGLDEQEKNEAVPCLNEKVFKHEIVDEIRKFIENVLLSEKSKVFELKKDICNYSLTKLEKVKKLRMYLDQFKYKIFEEYRPDLSSMINLSNDDANQYVL
jgi:predicted RNA binding protein with dsRBD fold (UPF0201 family)